MKPPIVGIVGKSKIAVKALVDEGWQSHDLGESLRHMMTALDPMIGDQTLCQVIYRDELGWDDLLARDHILSDKVACMYATAQELFGLDILVKDIIPFWEPLVVSRITQDYEAKWLKSRGAFIIEVGDPARIENDCIDCQITETGEADLAYFVRLEVEKRFGKKGAWAT